MASVDMTAEYEFPGFTQTHHRSVYPAIDPTNKANSAAGKVILITGGGIGVGKGIAKAFVTAGAKAIAILGRRENILLEAKTELESAGSSKILTFKADTLDEVALEAAFKSTSEQVGPINVAIANAGYLSTPAPAATADVADYWKAFEINIKGTLLTWRAFLKYKAAEGAVFEALNTVGAHAGAFPAFSSYAASKIGEAHMVAHFQVEQPDVRVVQFHPGVIESEMNEKSHMPFSKDDLSLPSSFAVWLASPAASWVGGKFLWAHWDVDELLKLKEEVETKNELGMGLLGWPKVPKPTLVK